MTKYCRKDRKEILNIFLCEDGLYEVRILGQKEGLSIILSKEDIQDELDHPRKDSEIGE